MIIIERTKWTTEKTIQLIKEVQQHDRLWSIHKTTNHNNCDCWGTIAKSLAVNEKRCIYKWSKLRNDFIVSPAVYIPFCIKYKYMECVFISGQAFGHRTGCIGLGLPSDGFPIAAAVHTDFPPQTRSHIRRTTSGLQLRPFGAQSGNATHRCRCANIQRHIAGRSA